MIDVSYYCFGLLAGAFVLSTRPLALFFTGNTVLSHPLPFKYLGRLFMASTSAAISLIALGIALVGLWSHLSSLLWLYMEAGSIVQIFRGLFGLSEHAGNFTLFGWIANVPVESVGRTWLIVMAVSVIVLFIPGIAGYHRRDLSL